MCKDNDRGKEAFDAYQEFNPPDVGPYSHRVIWEELSPVIRASWNAVHDLYQEKIDEATRGVGVSPIVQYNDLGLPTFEKPIGDSGLTTLTIDEAVARQAYLDRTFVGFARRWMDFDPTAAEHITKTLVSVTLRNLEDG